MTLLTIHIVYSPLSLDVLSGLELLLLPYPSQTSSLALDTLWREIKALPSLILRTGGADGNTLLEIRAMETLIRNVSYIEVTS